MEALKRLEEIGQPDSRYVGYSLVNKVTGAKRPYTIKEHHDSVNSIALTDKVPEDIQEHFETGRNLLLYSWYVYPFIAVAQLHFSICLEAALRQRLGIERTNDGPGPGLKRLIEAARSEGVLDGIDLGKFDGALSFVPSMPDETKEEWLFGRAIEIVRFFRNNLAHGKVLLYPDGGFVQTMTAVIVNHLYAGSKC